MKQLLLLLCALSAILGAAAIDDLNALRTSAGLAPFAVRDDLQTAAANHSRYLQLHDTSGHYETEGDDGYTGVYPSDRAVYAGYPSRLVSENVSVGQRSVEESIDGLFSAIYHRFGFLSLTNDEIGIGVSDDVRHFTYDMGNAEVRALCENDTYAGGDYYVGVCADETRKVAADDFLAAVDTPKKEAPQTVVWPPADAADIPPAFFEESPDPLPDHGVTGYPVSIQFNDAKFDEPPTLESFTLATREGDAVEILTLMDKDNDPNKEFSGYEYALFPKHRLEWGSTYRVSLSWSYQGATETLSWCFATRSLDRYARKVYRVEGDSANLDVVSGTAYALYLVPSDTNDTVGSYSYSYTASAVSMSFIDANTFAVTLTGDPGEYAKITFSDGKTVTLTLAQSDTALPPENQTCTEETMADDTSTTGDDTAASSDGTAPSDTTAAEETAGTRSPLTLEVADENGDYRTVEGGYTLDDGDTRIAVSATEEGRVRYEVTAAGGTTSLTLPLEGSRIAIDANRTGTIQTEAVTLFAYPDGTFEVRAAGAPLPAGRLPAGTLFTLEGGRLEIVTPLLQTIRFQE